MVITMKFVRRISVFFIYPMTMFIFGFASGTVIQDFFYPGEQYQEIKEIEQKKEEEAVVETVFAKEPVITADTSYIVISYDMHSKKAEEKNKTDSECISSSDSGTEVLVIPTNEELGIARRTYEYRI